MTKEEKFIAIAAGLVAVIMHGLIVYLALFSRYAERASQEWQTAGEECIRNLDRVCQRERNVPRRVIGSSECQMLYEDFSLFGVFECKKGKLYAEIWVGRLSYSVKDREVVWTWAR
jgi:hypothetical protein